MIINADTLVPHLKEKVRPTQSDASRHLICPNCQQRTKLNVLGDGRRKCTICGKKFRIHKVTDEKKIQQCAEILLSFCLDFSPSKTSQLTHYRHRLISDFYNHFRTIIVEHSLPPEKIKIIVDPEMDVRPPHEKSRCRWCKNKMLLAEKKLPVFGMQFSKKGEVYIDPLKDDEATVYFQMLGLKGNVSERFTGYAGFICCGKLHRFGSDIHARDSADRLWTWRRERVRSHGVVWNKNAGFYLKELEWKYNHRLMNPEQQALSIIELMPANFLTSWSL